MRMLVCSQMWQKIGDGDSSILLKLLESMIDGCISFLCDVVPNIINKLSISDAIVGGEVIFDGSDFLSG